MGKVTVVGSSNIDFVLVAEKLPKEGETVISEEFQRHFGGKGANQAIAAKRAGANTSFITKLGKDNMGYEYYNYLIDDQGLSPKGIYWDESKPTGMAFIVVDKSGRNQIVVFPGANDNLTASDIMRVNPEDFISKVLLIQWEIPMNTVLQALKRAKFLGMYTIVNPAPAIPISKIPGEIFSLTDMIIPNEREAEVLTGVKVERVADAIDAGNILLSLNVKDVLITLGKSGCLWKSKVSPKEYHHLVAFAVEAVDTTAAGDAFCGAIAWALSEEMPVDKAMIYANAAGALATTKFGAQPSLPTLAEIELLSR